MVQLVIIPFVFAILAAVFETVITHARSIYQSNPKSRGIVTALLDIEQYGTVSADLTLAAIATNVAFAYSRGGVIDEVWVYSTLGALITLLLIGTELFISRAFVNPGTDHKTMRKYMTLPEVAMGFAMLVTSFFAQ